MSFRDTFITYATIIAFGGLLAACDDTIRGIGQDTKQTVDAVSDSVQGNPEGSSE
ncbi:MAG: EncA/B family entericidin [Minwuia sp.]|uniref:EncA/B family entericidin n=1 Tax=Minwuia sp. TaxID=2493630 RepID=UPI003A857B73